MDWLKTSDSIVFTQSETGNETYESRLPQDWNSIVERRSMQVVERQSRLNVDVHNLSPALTNEAFPLKLVISSEEDVAENINIIVTLKPDDHSESFYQSVCISAECDHSKQPCKTLEMKFDDLKYKEKVERVVYVRSAVAGTACVTVQTFYNVLNLPVKSTLVIGKQLKQITCPSRSTCNVCFDVVDPFDFTAHLTSMNMESISSVYAGQPFMVLGSLTAHSPWPIEILSSKHILPVKSMLDVVSTSQRDNISVLASEGESVVNCLALVASYAVTKPGESFNLCTKKMINILMFLEMAELGIYTITWKRHGCDGLVTETSLKMPNLSIR